MVAVSERGGDQHIVLLGTIDAHEDVAEGTTKLTGPFQIIPHVTCLAEEIAAARTFELITGADSVFIDTTVAVIVVAVAHLQTIGAVIGAEQREGTTVTL